MSEHDLWQIIEELRRRITALESTATARAPMAVTGLAFVSQQTLTGTAFALGDCVKCVAGAWSLCTSADTGPLLCGVISAVSGTSQTVTLAGERSDPSAAGTTGDLYWVPDIGGGVVTTPSAMGMQRCIERQISPTIRLVLPDPLSWFAVSVTTCDGGVATPHDMAYYLNDT